LHKDTLAIHPAAGTAEDHDHAETRWAPGSGSSARPATAARSCCASRRRTRTSRSPSSRPTRRRGSPSPRCSRTCRAHGPALDLGATLADAGTRVVDLSAAFRLDAEGFATWYGEPHPRPDLTPAVYGLTEHTRDAVAGATLVANPGCYPTATLLGLLPLVDLVDPATVVVDAKSGTSGAGRGATDTLHASHVHGNLTPYGAPAHRHTGEVEAGLVRLGGASPAPVSFTPHLLPVARGLLATCYATLVDGAGADDVAAALHDAYDTEPFVHVLPAGTFPGIKQVVGSNACHLSAVVDPRTRRVVVTSVIDNLGKGAAGQALQNLNLLLGLDETAGLSAIGVYP
jgi:N-acetyl-gamma-glutamyl-phosphate reductase